VNYTGHKLQGQTKETIVVSDYHYRNNWMYVILSRVKTRNELFVREPINGRKLMNPIQMVASTFMNNGCEIPFL
jgi:hypothetical protein